MQRLSATVEVELGQRGSNHGDHWTSNAYFDVPVVAHVGVRDRILGTDMPAMIARVGTFRPEEPKLLEGYRRPHDSHGSGGVVEQDGMAPMVMKLNVANLYDYVTSAGMHARR
jgi:hypothetical protein